MTFAKLNNRSFTGDLNNFVDEMFADLPDYFKNGFNNSERKFQTPVNVKETDKGYELEVLAPGFEKSDFNISVENEMLTISGEKKEVKEEKGKDIRKEYSYKSFKRSFTMDDKIDATNIEASYINGVLRLNLPKKAEVKPEVKAIEIK
jgi:HSP20 family protein